MAELGGLVHRSRRHVEARVKGTIERLTDELGGTARRRVIILLACVLGLESADSTAIGATAPQIESALHISNTGLGLLVTVTALVGAAATLPMGTLVDRTPRVRLVAAAIVAWGLAEAVSAASVSFTMLLLTRLGLGIVVAAAGPTVASLTGDLFPGDERARIYGFILTGQLLGAGFGLLSVGFIAGAFGWRPAIAILAIPSLALSVLLVRLLPEPARGGQSWLSPGATEIVAESDVAPGEPGPKTTSAAPAAEGGPGGEILEQLEAQDIEPEETIVVDEDPTGWSLGHAIRYVLRIKTNVVMIVASSFGYFFFSGLSTFALVFVRGHFGIGQSLATLFIVIAGVGAIGGIVLAGREADRAIAHGHLTARLDVGVIGYTGAAIVLVPAILITNLAAFLPLLVLTAAAVAAPNATLDAARLDVVPAQLWGRAEGIRTVLRTVLGAFAPLVFGLVSAQFGGSGGGFGASGRSGATAAGSPAEARGLGYAFLIMLIPLALSGLMLIRGRRSYPVDVASAADSQRRLQDLMSGPKPEA